MERGIKDEAFVRRALSEAVSEDGRWIANQSGFNFSNTDTLDPATRAAVVTSTSIYFQKGKLPEEAIEEALNITTCGEARTFIDKYTDKTL